jgi:DNA polymerase-3 subunit gamma/tau
LSQAIASGRIGHAFLFVGSRGTGKTSTARILAKALNCASGPTPTPCGTCDSCIGIEEGTDVDVLEIDAASNNSVDNIRELREKIAFRPMRGRFRIIILDEVHMLSTGAFNALLKTLEEPPAHAKFIFATTAPEKIPDTIRSRCHVFEFRRIDETAIARRLADICKFESLAVPEAVLQAIARAARGGMRDSLSLLDQLVAFAGASPTEADLARVMGTAGRETLFGLAKAVLEERRADILTFVQEHMNQGGEPVELLNQLADFFRSCLAIALCGHDTPLVTEIGDVRELYISCAGRAGADRLEAIVRHIVFARERARFAGPLARASVECALLAASRSGEVNTIPALLDRLAAIEKAISSGTTAQPAFVTPPPATVRPAPVVGTAPAAPQVHTAATLLASLANRNAYGRALRDFAASSSFDGTTLKLTMRPLDDVKRAFVGDPQNRAGAERFLGELAPGARIQIEWPVASAPQPGAPQPGASARPAAPLPPGSPPAALSPAARAVVDATRGRILGQFPPTKNQPSSES